jgi:type I restriction enzyme S subunit
MAGEWKTFRLGDIVEIFDGPHATPKKTDSGPVFLGIWNFSNGRLDLSETEHLSENDFERWSRRVTPSAGDIVFSYETRLGEAAAIPPNLKCCLGRRMGLLRPKNRSIDSRFLLYAYLGPEFQDTIRERTIHGSTVDRIPLVELPEFPIRIPDIAEQRVIANVLGSLDDKIELNRKMNETLEAMARALFKSWFVDFDPVRAKAEGRDTGLPAPIAALFPNSFADSSLGKIPKGWTVSQLGTFAEVIDCLHSKKPERRVKGRPLLQLWNIRQDAILDMTDPYFIAEEDYEKWISRIEASRGDCVITNVGRVGAVAQIPEGFKAALGRNMTAIRCRSGHPFPTFLVQALTSRAMLEEIDLRTDSGTILDSLNVRNIPKLRVVLPPISVLSEFERCCRPLRARMEYLQNESVTLANVRDSLLPKLISGEIRLNRVASLVEANA